MAIDFRVRDFFHPFLILRLHREMERLQWRPLPELRRYQEALLRRTIRHAYERVPYYQRLFHRLGLTPDAIRTVEDLKKLPLLSRETARLAGEDLLAQGAARRHSRPYSSSGSSGPPLTVYHGRESNALEFAYYWRHWGWAGFRPGMPFAELQTTFFLRGDDLSDRPSHWQPHLRRLLLNSNRLGPARAAAMAGAIRRRGCRFLKGLATTLAGFALACRDAGLTDLRFRALFATGESLRPRNRVLLDDVFGSPVLDSFGHMERAVAVSQCPQGGYHVNMDYGVLEVEDLRPPAGGDGRTLVGRAVGTSLHNPVMPFIRYDTGDEIEVFAETTACSCGRTLPLVKAVDGRAGSTVITPAGNYLTSLYVLADLMAGAHMTQYVQETPEHLSLRVVPDGGWDRGLRERALALVRRAVGPDMSVSVREVVFDELVRGPSGKIPTVIPFQAANGSIDVRARD